VSASEFPHIDKPKTCTADNCDKKAHARGVCANHYRKKRNLAGGKFVREKKPRSTCLLCPIKVQAKGLCSAHYVQYWKLQRKEKVTNVHSD